MSGKEVLSDISFSDKKILVTGAAGFIGAALCQRLLKDGKAAKVIGLDNLNDYYDSELKEDRLKGLKQYPEFSFVLEDIAHRKTLFELFEREQPDIVVNLAAQAGVRYSITNPDAFADANLIGFYNILECCRHFPPEHLVFASSSSVYGNTGKDTPFSEDDNVDQPVSLYAATKRAGELLAYSYAKLYAIPLTGLRFFTVYGPMGRPDMAYFSFAEKLCRGERIPVFNYGNCKRDFTYIDDIIEGIVRVMHCPPLEETVPFRILNIGNHRPEKLIDFIHVLCTELMRVGLLEGDYTPEGRMDFLPPQPGDVEFTYADNTRLAELTGYRPVTDLRTGLGYFADWYREYRKKQESNAESDLT